MLRARSPNCFFLNCFFLDIGDIEDGARHYDLDSRGVVVDRPDVVRYSHLHPVPPPSATRLVRAKRFLEDHSLLARVVWIWVDLIATGSGGERKEDAFNVARARWSTDGDLYQAYGRQGLETAARRLEALRLLLARHGVPMTLVVYPWPDQVLAGQLDSLQSRFWRRWCEARGVQFIDLFPAFLDGNNARVVIDACYIRGDIHFNRMGHARAAAAFLRLFKPGWTSWRPESIPDGMIPPAQLQDLPAD